MSCLAIAGGYTKPCGDSQGGVGKFYITEWANINQDTYAEASGVITTLALTAGKKFWLYEQELQTANYTEVQTSNRTAGTTFVDQTFNCTLLKRSAATSYAIRALATQDVAIISVDQTGTMFLLGRAKGMRLEPSTSTSGTNMGDASKYDLVFKGMEPTLAPTVSTAILATVIV
jgi:hypothetical protein